MDRILPGGNYFDAVRTDAAHAKRASKQRRIDRSPGQRKTTLLDEFRRRHPYVTENAGDPTIPIIIFDMPPDASESRFWSAMLRAMYTSFRESENAAKKQSLAMDCLRSLRVQCLVIDEIHNAQHGSIRETRQFMAVLRNLMNALSIPIIVAGTKAAIVALNTDSQLVTRFEAIGLPLWQLDSEFLRLLKTLERMMPLAEPSGLASREVAPLIHQMSGGTIGGVVRIVAKATHLALEKNEEKISIQLLQLAKRQTADVASLANFGI